MTPVEAAYWTPGRQTVAVLERRTLWGRAVAEVLVPSTGRTLVVDAADLGPAAERAWSRAEVTYRAAAGRFSHELAHNALAVAPRERLEVLPHQLAALQRARAADPVRLLLADEVGLGKTIEAGLIYTDLRTRGRVRRVLIVCPKAVLLQWVAEMQDRFGEAFALVGQGGVPMDAGFDPWRQFDRVVTSVDAVKPMRRRRGWKPDQLEQYNQRRFAAVVDAGWDLVVFDEAHHVAGSTADVSRHQLAAELARRTPHVLLLSATPHSGKSEAFARLLGLLDPSLAAGEALTQEHVARWVVRTEKRQAKTANGEPLFQARTTSTEIVPYGSRHIEAELYEAVTQYVRDGYQRALREHRPAVGFLVLLMQRLVSSSTAAILGALQRRAAALEANSGGLLPLDALAEEWHEQDGDEQLAVLEAVDAPLWRDERRDVEALLHIARQAARQTDAKATHLLDLLARLRREERDADLKVVVFTEFRPTQRMMAELLEGAGFRVVTIHGDLTITERRAVQREFAEGAQILVSTDAGGEGVNLQFAHIVVNYDLPWNPMRIEQRIGRVDRIGQRDAVRAFNLVSEHSVDARVLEVLEAKLETIRAELGADKWGDVLESVSSGRRVEELYAAVIGGAADLSTAAETFVQATRADLDGQGRARSLLPADTPTAPPMTAPIWRGLFARAQRAWRVDESEPPEKALSQMPQMLAGESVAVVHAGVSGVWSLWEVRPDATTEMTDYFALFLQESTRVRPDHAERIWDGLARGELDVAGTATFDPVVWNRCTEEATNRAYEPSRRLCPPERWRAPWLRLRLLVQVEP